MASLSTLVPVNYVLTSGQNSVMSWTNVLTLSTANCSTVNASSIVTNSIGANALTVSTLSVSTLTSRTVNVSTITGSSISSNVLTLSLTNASTQNTQIYQVATTNPTTSYTAIQASHVSTGTTNNALVLNPSGGNVGVGTTAPTSALQVSASNASATTTLTVSNSTNTNTGYGAQLLFDNAAGQATLGSIAALRRDNAADFSSYMAFSVNTANATSLTERMRITNGGNVGIGTTAPGAALDVVGTVRGSIFTTQSAGIYAGNSTNTFTLIVPYPATYLFTVTGNGAYVGGGGDNYAKAIIYIHIGSSGVLLTTVVQAQGVAINSYTPGTQTLSYNIGTGGLPIQFGGNSNVSIIRLG